MKTFLFLALAELANNTPQLVPQFSEDKHPKQLGHLYDTLDSSSMALIAIDPKKSLEFQAGYLQGKLEELFGYADEQPLYLALVVNNALANEYQLAVVPNPEYPIEYRVNLNPEQDTDRETRSFYEFQHALNAAYSYSRQTNAYTVEIIPVDPKDGEPAGGGLLYYQKICYKVHDGDLQGAVKENSYFYSESEARKRYRELALEGRAYLESQPDYGEPEFGEWYLLETNVVEDQDYIIR